MEILQQQDFQDFVAYIPYRKNAVTQTVPYQLNLAHLAL